jgi:predicted dehydrogenase
MSQYKAIPKPIRLGLIGCRGIVQGTHGPCYQALPDAVRVVALADPLAE